jgi:hypothetical protein
MSMNLNGKVARCMGVTGTNSGGGGGGSSSSTSTTPIALEGEKSDSWGLLFLLRFGKSGLSFAISNKTG